MVKTFYTEKDIEDMFKGGTMSLEMNEDIVLTELAYEKAKSLGLSLLRSRPELPPSAPVRPYISKQLCQCPISAHAAPESASPAPTMSESHSSPTGEMNLRERVRNAVVARLGAQVDPSLLDVIIRRVMDSAGVR